MQKITLKLFWALLLALPLIVFKYNAESPYDLIRLFIATVVSFILLLIYFFSNLNEDRIKIKFSIPLALLTGTLISTLISYFLSINPFVSMWGIKLLPTDSLWSVIVTYTLAFLVYQALSTIEDVKNILKILILVLFIQVCFGFAQVYNLDPFWWAASKQIYGTFGLTIGFATVVGCLLTILTYFFFRAKNKYSVLAIWIGLLLSSKIILHSGSRSPIFATLLAVTAVITYYFFKSKNLRWRSLSVVLCLTLSGIWFSNDPQNKEFKYKINKDYMKYSAQVRYEMTLNALSVFKEKPLFGHGPETFLITQRQYQSANLNRSYWQNAWVKAHNNVAQALACTGIFGAFFLVASFFYIVATNLKLLFKEEFSDRNSLAFVIGCSYCLMFVANLTCFNIVYSNIFYYFFPLAFVFILKQNNPPLSFQINKYIKNFVFITASMAFFILTLSSFKHWYTDFLYQESRRVKLQDSNWTLSIDYLERAININEHEPYFYCFKAGNLSEMLVNNFKRLPETEVQKAVSVINEVNQKCLDLSINREHPVGMAAQTYLNLYTHQLVKENSNSLNTLKHMIELAPNNPEAHQKISALYFDMKQIDLYMYHIQKAIEVKQDYIPAYLDLLNYYYENKRLDDARALVNKVTDIEFLSAEFIPGLITLAKASKTNNDENSVNQLLEFYSKNKHLISF
jgi:O-antigen ligase